ncbi:Uncharacterised protein [uncultured archaeon]|nr:Uncharacterised protein [uncultured archaeon]
MINKNIVYIMASMIVGLLVVGIVSADPSPNGPGQPGAPNNVCGLSNPVTPGSSSSAPGSAFNGSGVAGTVYAGNPGTASFLHANSVHAVSQYDIACFQVSQNHP